MVGPSVGPTLFPALCDPVEGTNEISGSTEEGTDIILLLVVIQIPLHHLFKKQKLAGGGIYL